MVLVCVEDIELVSLIVGIIDDDDVVVVVRPVSTVVVVVVVIAAVVVVVVVVVVMAIKSYLVIKINFDSNYFHTCSRRNHCTADQTYSYKLKY